jgi:hypothetical protein
MCRLTVLAAMSAAVLTASFAGGNAQQPIQRVRVGVLECRGSASVGFVVGSVTNLGCVLRVEGVPEDRYIATIRKLGVDLGITQDTTLAWGVYAPVARIGQGDLAGRPGRRLGRRRPRRQCAGRRFRQFDRAAAVEPAGPARPQRRSRVGKSGTPAGKVTAPAARQLLSEFV